MPYTHRLRIRYHARNLAGAIVIALATTVSAPPAVAVLIEPPQCTIEGSQRSELGRLVGTAGDVNGDGYSDAVTGEVFYDGQAGVDCGRARLFLGGPAGPDSTADWVVYGQAGWKFGAAYTAGDVNGDGYDDLLVGASEYTNGQNHEGAIFLYLGSPSGLSAVASWSYEGNEASALFYKGATAGDLNADGYDDFVVTGSHYVPGSGWFGRVPVFYGSASGPAATPALILAGSATDEDSFGWDAGTAGDVNGDGYADLFVTAPHRDGFFGLVDCGAAFIYHGGPSGIDATFDWANVGDQMSALFGLTASLAGDINGDGYGDFIVGSSVYDGAATDTGRAAVYLGGASGLAGSPVRIYDGTQSDERFATCVATAGDVNGDGYADLAIGSSLRDEGQTNEGEIFIYYGGVTGPSAAPCSSIDSNLASSFLGMWLDTAGDVNGDGYSDLIAGASGANNFFGRVTIYLGSADSFTSAVGYSAEANQVDANLGVSVGFADVNGDGYSDLVAGAPNQDGGRPDAGLAWCLRGGPDGITSNGFWSTEGTGNTSGFGSVVAGAGDIDGDGYEDLIVTSPSYDGSLTNEGRAQAFHGSENGLAASAAWTVRGQEAGAAFGTSAASAGDVNGDGYGDVIVGAPYHANPQVDEGSAALFLGSAAGLQAGAVIVWEGNQDGARAGMAVACAGDVNGDGYSDVVSGAPGYDNGEIDEGVVFVFFGGAGGMSPSPSQILEMNIANAGFGSSLAPAGDVNGDGYSDLIVGAPHYTNGQSNEGLAVVLLGSSTGLRIAHAFTWESNQAGANLGAEVAGAGDVDRDGYSDVVFSAPLYGAADAGRVYVFRGSPNGVVSTPFFVRNGDNGHFGAAVAGFGDADGDGDSDLAVGASFYANGQSGEGLVNLFYGNRHETAITGRPGVELAPRMRRADGSGPLALLDRSDSPSSFRFEAFARSAYGRVRVRTEWEVATVGIDWTGNATAWPDWVDTGLPGPSDVGSRITLQTTATGLTGDTAYRWRVRTRADTPYFPRSPWLSPAGNASMETDVRMPADVSDVEDLVTKDGRVRFDSVEPNPSRGRIVARFALPSAGTAELTVHDATGRRIATIPAGNLEAGAHASAWDGRDASDRMVVPGVYFLRLSVGGEVRWGRVVIAR